MVVRVLAFLLYVRFTHVTWESSDADSCKLEADDKNTRGYMGAG